jgi:hypothetical protein
MVNKSLESKNNRVDCKYDTNKRNIGHTLFVATVLALCANLLVPSIGLSETHKRHKKHTNAEQRDKIRECKKVHQRWGKTFYNPYRSFNKSCPKVSTRWGKTFYNPYR